MPRPLVLITGSSGFLGQAIAARLVRHCPVVGLDTVQPKRPLEGVETVLVDLTSDDNVHDVLKEVRDRWPRRSMRTLRAGATVLRNPWVAVAAWRRAVPANTDTAGAMLSTECLAALHALGREMCERAC